MWIVELALRRPYTFVVMAVLRMVLGVAAILSMPTDIFPYIDIPVVSVVWAYSGMSPEEMAHRIVTVSERAMTTTVNNIEHMESSSYNGVAVIRVFFQPGVKVEIGYRPDHGALADHPPALAARNLPAQYHQLRRDAVPGVCSAGPFYGSSHTWHLYMKARTELERATGRILPIHNVTFDEAVHGRVERRPTAIPATPPGS